MRAGARFCTRCGAPAAVEAPAMEPATEPAAEREPELASAPEPIILAEASAPERASLVIGPPPIAAAAPPPDADRASAAREEPPTGGVLTIAPEVPPLTKGRRWTAPPVRSHAATAAFITGVLPLLVSLFGNSAAAALTADAAAQSAGETTSGAWTTVFVVLALVFVINAALLTVCAITAGRGLRETANGITRGRGLAVAGLVVGGLNLVLWLIGLVVTLTTLSAALG